MGRIDYHCMAAVAVAVMLLVVARRLLGMVECNDFSKRLSQRPHHRSGRHDTRVKARKREHCFFLSSLIIKVMFCTSGLLQPVLKWLKPQRGRVVEHIESSTHEHVCCAGEYPS